MFVGAWHAWGDTRTHGEQSPPDVPSQHTRSRAQTGRQRARSWRRGDERGGQRANEQERARPARPHGAVGLDARAQADAVATKSVTVPVSQTESCQGLVGSYRD